jgi:hypothetical protein
MSKINYEEDRTQSITQADTAKSLSDKVIELKNLEDEIENAENSISKLKEKAKTLSQFEIPVMMEEMILPLPLAGAKTTRRANTQPLHKVRGLNPSRKLAFIPRHLKQ